MKKMLVSLLASFALAAFCQVDAQQPAKKAPAHARGHVEPKTPEQKAKRLANHFRSYQAHHHLLAIFRRTVTPPASWDSRTKTTGGASWIPPIVDQGQCGSCWDFSGTGVATVAFNVALGPQAPGPLSEQYTLDCGQNGGCNGDDNTTVLAWAKATGLPTTAQYGPYQGQAGQCKQGVALNKITDWGYCTPSNTNAVANVNDIKLAIMTYGCVGCGIDASSDAFGNYTTGTFVAAPSSNIDHDIILVGWQDGAVSDNSGGYWILRNSWGTSWGQQGYMFISYGSAGVGWEAVWAVVNSPTPPSPTPPGPTPTPAATTITLSGPLAQGTYIVTPSGTPSVATATQVTITFSDGSTQTLGGSSKAACPCGKPACHCQHAQDASKPCPCNASANDARNERIEALLVRLVNQSEAQAARIEKLEKQLAGPKITNGGKQ